MTHSRCEIFMHISNLCLCVCVFAASRTDQKLQQCHEHPQHALHWTLHSGDDPEIDCLQTQGRCTPPQRTAEHMSLSEM